MDKHECEDKYFEPETEEHLNGKRDLYEWIKKQHGVTNAVLEGWIPQTKQRPDIVFEYNGYKCVIEYQCSPIASEYIERHELYKAAGINDIWICGTKKYLGHGKRFNTLENESRIYYDSENQYIYILDNLSEKEFIQIVKIQSIRGHLYNYYREKQYFNRNIHIMKNVFDYTAGYVNYLCIKDVSNYCCIGCHYPSPTGRSSNKYPYPVKDYGYSRNNSYATCYKLSNTELKDINRRYQK
jgi:competence CoiA-like predicted nuclease